jgi:dihydroxyacetone kinase DhaKLM complex PTS-EIIA-like component DhaM
MSLVSRLTSFATAVAQEIKQVRADVEVFLILGPTDEIPVGTSSNTIIFRTVE